MDELPKFSCNSLFFTVESSQVIVQWWSRQQKSSLSCTSSLAMDSPALWLRSALPLALAGSRAG